uniref:Pre-rRNA processing protein n=1 Tax=Lotharella vacuolata TaxID=74820 RepID=A0A0H5BHP5_9EUKA|nr:pre-rRNA processing protein [Lotharella vacuolata]
MFKRYNDLEKLHILLDSSFLHYIIKNKIDFFKSFNLFFNKNYILYTTECIIKEILNLTMYNKVLVRFLNISAIKKLKCYHNQSYGDRCIIKKLKTTNFFIVATQDKLLIKTTIKVYSIYNSFLK